MLNFKTFIAEASKGGKNLHMIHIEDQVLYGGVEGARSAIFGLRSMRNMLAGHMDKGIDATVKWDGAPAIFCGIVPPGNDRAGKFFVAKKGLFNSSPKYYTTDSEIDVDVSGDLAAKFKACLAHLPKVVKGGVWQGDLLFSKGDVKNATIDGENYVTFHPNTIVYAIPINAGADEVLAAQIGIVFHTKYSGGKTFADMKSSFNVSASDFGVSKSVWLRDAKLHDISSATLSASHTQEITGALSDAGRIFQKISGTTLREIENNQELAQILETFNNTYVRRGEVVTDTAKHVKLLIEYIKQKFAKEIEKRSTPAAKGVQTDKMNGLLAFFSESNKENLKLIYDLQNAIVKTKLIIINKLDLLNNTRTFIKTKNGYKVTTSEGYVVVDHLNKTAAKLVNRMEFSYNNFSADVIKGWDKV